MMSEKMTAAPTETNRPLETLNLDVLRALARRLGLSKIPTAKPQVIEMLRSFLTANLSDLVAKLSGAEARLLAECLHGDHDIDPVRFTAKYGAAWPFPKPWDGGQASLLQLLGAQTGGVFRISEDLAASLRPLVPEPPKATVATTGSLPAVCQPPKKSWREPEGRPIHVHCGEKIALLEARAVLKLAHAGKLRVADKSSRPTDAAVRLISECLPVPDFEVEQPPEIARHSEPAGAIRAYAWGVLVGQCDWAKARAGKLILTPAGQKMLNAGTVEDFREGVEGVWYDDDFDEFNRVNHIRGQSGRGRRYLSSPSERRLAITESISEWPVGQWISFEEAFRFVYASGHSFEVTRMGHTLYFQEQQYGHLGAQETALNRVYFRAFLMETLATLGLVDIGYTYPHRLWPDVEQGWGADDMSFCSRYDGLLYVRLNALGAYCLGVSETYEAPPVEAGRLFHLLPNRDIVVAGERELPAPDRHMLEMFAVPKGDFVWSLDARRILAHLESGGSIQDLRLYLESQSGGELPETIRSFLADVARRTAAVRGVEPALLIEIDDPAVAALIAHDPQAGKCCYLAGDRHLAALAKNRRALATAMKKLGFILPHDGVSA